jgi:DNA/RNA-binding domain of Phe-tRNA-synthetase-like protein
MTEFSPQISPAIWAMRQDFVALSIVVQGCSNDSASPWIEQRLVEAEKAAATGPAWADDHIASWQEALRLFSAKPQRTPCSAESLRKRALRGDAFPRINPIVDLYNAVSIAYAVPVGGEDISRYVGLPKLSVANGDEEFETVKEGVPYIEHPEKGEVIWRNDRGVTCRRWNWRQGPRTRITAQTTNAWFVLERLDPMPVEALQEAAEKLIAGLRKFAPDVCISSELLMKPT